MNIASWRDIAAARLAPAIGQERDRWASQLHWDYSQTLDDVERARVAGDLPGLVALEGDDIAGWSYYLTHRHSLLIGHLSASRADVTRGLLDAILKSDEAQSARSMIVFGFFDAPDLHLELLNAGFVVEPYAYMSRDLAAPMDSPRRECVPYELTDNRAVARLLQGTYLTAPPNRPFAVGDTEPEWVEYVTQLTYGNGCGLFDLRASVVRGSGGVLDAVAIVSAISKDTAHLCQLAVNPGAKRTGLGFDMLAAACARARQNGRARMTLTVASSNTAALGLYRRFGFTDVARFTFARR
ncbi:MAG TPA: N-acetyltransferase [Vicinamibacterales bacterium]|nr:N-acetyltransferase [Vicinamibacterales bacterium]